MPHSTVTKVVLPLYPQPHTEKRGRELPSPLSLLLGGSRQWGAKDPAPYFGELLKVKDVESWRSLSGAHKASVDAAQRTVMEAATC